MSFNLTVTVGYDSHDHLGIVPVAFKISIKVHVCLMRNADPAARAARECASQRACDHRIRDAAAFFFADEYGELRLSFIHVLQDWRSVSRAKSPSAPLKSA